jgi:AbrB family looped-hinge helix DNA binding protein
VSNETLSRAHYHGNIHCMTIARSKVTAQGQISVPLEVRRKLGIGPGAVLEWDEADNQMVVRRAGRYSSEDIHQALFGDRVSPHTSLAELKAGVRRNVAARHARR